ncbi:hypothetical protein DP130_05185 [Clostridium tetani]|uniref:Type II secretion system protein GspF domain-containing protein n=1 Tax=Clostridium tetani TaxID=1513 RepID=A0A4Q0VDX9_CLOTA|nr:type II secretion system F family protein [Clostridium tetani]RXI49450.1 hypothetical protein DP130_05185 [Clostridium tetani]
MEKNRLNLKERWLFCKQLKLLISSGMNVTDALEITGDFFTRKSVKNSIEEIRKKVYLGENISEAMSYFRGIYPSFLINMIKLGEDNGILTEVLEKLELYYENQCKISNKIKEIIIYPLFLIFFSIIISLFLSGFILPQFESILRDFNGEVPIFTKSILNLFKFLKDNRSLILIFLSTTAMIVIYKLKKNSINIKYEVLRRIAFLKNIYYKLQIYKILMCLWMTLKCGMNIDKALEEACLIVEDDKIVKDLKRVNFKVTQGVTIGEAFEEGSDKLMGKDIVALIKTGEESGNLENILKDICDMTREEIIIKINSMVKLIEPIIILLISINIGILIIALFLPILGIMDGITNI